MLSVFNIFGMTLSATRPPALEASTLPLDYRGGIVNMITVHKDSSVTVRSFHKDSSVTVLPFNKLS